MAKIIQEGVITIEVMEVDNEDNPYRARVVGMDDWFPGPTVRQAVAGAANTATAGEIEDALGDLWEADDGE